MWAAMSRQGLPLRTPSWATQSPCVDQGGIVDEWLAAVASDNLRRDGPSVQPKPLKTSDC